MGISFINTITTKMVSVPITDVNLWERSTTPWKAVSSTTDRFNSVRKKIDLQKVTGLFAILQHCKQCIRGTVLARCFKSAIEGEDIESSMIWTQLINDCYSSAVLEWCKVFGTDSEPTHWKTVLGEEEAIGSIVQKACGISTESWNSLWRDMTNLRNNRISHDVIDTEVALRLPDMDLVILSCVTIYNCVISFIDDGVGPNGELIKIDTLDIELWRKNCEEEVSAKLGTSIRAIQDKNSYY